MCNLYYSKKLTMKKIILILLMLTTSCIGTRVITNNNGPSTQIEFYNSEMTKKLDFPFSDATIVNNVIYVAGQVGNIPGTNVLVERRGSAKHLYQFERKLLLWSMLKNRRTST